MSEPVVVNGQEYLGVEAAKAFVKEQTNAVISNGQLVRLGQVVPHIYLNGKIHFRREDLQSAIDQEKVVPSQRDPEKIRLRRVGGRFIADNIPS